MWRAPARTCERTRASGACCACHLAVPSVICPIAQSVASEQLQDTSVSMEAASSSAAAHTSTMSMNVALEPQLHQLIVKDGRSAAELRLSRIMATDVSQPLQPLQRCSPLHGRATARVKQDYQLPSASVTFLFADGASDEAISLCRTAENYGHALSRSRPTLSAKFCCFCTSRP